MDVLVWVELCPPERCCCPNPWSPPREGIGWPAASAWRGSHQHPGLWGAPLPRLGAGGEASARHLWSGGWTDSCLGRGNISPVCRVIHPRIQNQGGSLHPSWLPALGFTPRSTGAPPVPQRLHPSLLGRSGDTGSFLEPSLPRAVSGSLRLPVGRACGPVRLPCSPRHGRGGGEAGPAREPGEHSAPILFCSPRP